LGPKAGADRTPEPERFMDSLMAEYHRPSHVALPGRMAWTNPQQSTLSQTALRQEGGREHGRRGGDRAYLAHGFDL
jgi:hypothetical protein